MAQCFPAAFLSTFVLTLLISGVTPTGAFAQNMLDNGDLETVTAPNYGDNVGIVLPGWLRSHENPNPGVQSAFYYSELSVVKVDGPGGQPLTLYNSPYGQLTPLNLPDTDVTHAGTQMDGHYLRLNTRHYWSVLGQRFTAPHTGCIAFGGTTAGSFESSDLFRFGTINPFFGGVATNPDATYGMDNTTTIGNNGSAFVANQWTLLKQYYPVDAGTLYAWAYVLRPHFILDDAFATYVDNSYCPTLPASTPNPPSVGALPDLTPTDIGLTKSCTAATSVEHNGQVGQMWDCSVDVTVPTAPFAGTLSVTDLYTPISTTASEVVSSSAASGNFDCTAGASCTINGADFDASGTDTLAYSVFVTATELQDAYPMQNCVEGSYEDGSGAALPVAGNCVNAQWIPRSSVVKTCDPISAVTTGPMTLNCQIDVTGTNLAIDSFVMAADAFAALPPVIATITGQMMNVTSTEPWSCIDQTINAPGSIGICELSAADMLAAGGASTINVSLTFTTDQASGQVVNCPMTDILPASFIGAAGQRNSAPAIGAPQSATIAGLPDNCAVMDLPQPTLTPKVEDVSAAKVCKTPELATIQGVTGYTWDCKAEITVTPTPFAGTFIFEDDASNISIGTAQFLSSSEPTACSGLQTDQLSCVFDGTTMGAPQIVNYQLFTALTDPNQPIEWQNCIKGQADTAAGAFPAKPICVTQVIKPEIDPPTKPPVFTLKKGCRLAGVQEPNTFYSCSIYISQTSGGPITDPLIFDELFSTTSGNPASQYILNMQGTPAMPNGWNCQQPPYTNGASCTIAAADFNANTGHRIDAYVSIPTAAFGKDDFQNCAQVRIGDQVVGSAECVEIEEPLVETTFDVEKSCKETGRRYTLSPTTWFQPYQCTLTVTTNGTPFTGPLWLSEDLMFGPSSGAASIQNITSADPWGCAAPPYTPAGQGTQPDCHIQGTQFPASGSSTLTVDLMMNSAMDQFGAENCVSLGRGEVAGQSAALASDCFEIASPSNPALDISKTCAPAVQGADSIWIAQCEIVVSFQNFDPAVNRQFYIYDELSGNGPQTPLTSLMPFNTMGMGGWGPTTGTPAGFNNATGMLLNYLQPNGSGSVTLPYTATFSGPAGRPINGDRITNCAWITIPSLAMRAPTGPIGDEKTCVPITFPARAVDDIGGTLDPAIPNTPTGPVIGSGSIGSTRPDIAFPSPATPVTRPVLTIVKEQTGSCDANRNSQTYDCGFRLRVTNTGNGAYLGPLVVTDTGDAPGMASAQVVSGNGWTCGAVVSNALSCSNPAVSLAPGASSYVDLRMKVKALRKGGSFQDCAAVGVSENRTERVALVQKIMNDRGLNAGPVDGKPGQKTYAALSMLRRDLGLADSRAFDDALFEALGLPLQEKGAVSCVSATLPVMPAPTLQCNAATTVQQGETCACRYDNMVPSNATSCQCRAGYQLVNGKGCVVKAVPAPKPVPAPAPAPDKPSLKCDPRSTYQRGDICACIDPKNAKNISKTQCGCTNGLPMINGKCIPLVITPTGPVDDVDGGEKCLIKLNGICIK